MNESEERGELRMLIKNIINASYSRDLSTKIAAADHLKMCWQAIPQKTIRNEISAVQQELLLKLEIKSIAMLEYAPKQDSEAC